MNVLVPHHQKLSFSQCPFFQSPMRGPSFFPNPPARVNTIIRMGGGPRTFPGGVSKWQWKRMQAKKAKQLLKARLSRERQIYEMRKRAELKAAVSELERPWEVVPAEAPTLFSVGADEQVKVLADRFQRPGGFDLWSERDGPVLFESPDELPSARFFPKGVVHSVKPYRRVDGYGLLKGGVDVKGEALSGELREKGTLFGEDSNKVEHFDGFRDDGQCSSSDVNYERNGVDDGDGELRRNGNGSGRSVLSNDGGGFSDGRGRGTNRNGNGRKYVSRGVDGGENSPRSLGSGRYEHFDGFRDDGDCSSSDVNYERNGVDGDGGLRRNRNGNGYGRSVLLSSNGKHSSRNGVDGDDRLRRNERGNGRSVLLSSSGKHSSRNGVDGDDRLRRSGSGNGRGVLLSSNGKHSSRNGVDGDDRLRRNGNRRSVLSNDDGRFSDGGVRSSRLNYGGRNGLNVDGGTKRNGNGTKYVSRGVDVGEHSGRSLGSGRNEASFDGRSRSKGSGRRVTSKDVDRSSDGKLRRMNSGRRFVSKDVDRSNGLYSGGVGSVRDKVGGNSMGGRSQGKYTNRTSNSEVYDMGLQKEGSYGFPG